MWAPTGLLCEPDRIGLLYSRVPLERGPSEALLKGSSTVRVTLGRLRGIRLFSVERLAPNASKSLPRFPTLASLWAWPSGPAQLQSSPGESFYSRALPEGIGGSGFFRRTTRCKLQPSRSPGSWSTIHMRTLEALFIRSSLPMWVVLWCTLSHLLNAHVQRSVQSNDCVLIISFVHLELPTPENVIPSENPTAKIHSSQIAGCCINKQDVSSQIFYWIPCLPVLR